jgi:hypothetical protein
MDGETGVAVGTAGGTAGVPPDRRRLGDGGGVARGVRRNRADAREPASHAIRSLAVDLRPRQQLAEHRRGELVGFVARRNDADARARGLLVRRLDLFEDLADGVERETLALGFESALVPVGLDQRERRDQEGLEQPLGAMLGGVFLRERDGLVLVARDQALVEARFRREHRLDAEQYVEVAEFGDVAPDYRDAHGERHREQQPDRAPQPGPEDRRGDDGYR